MAIQRPCSTEVILRISNMDSVVVETAFSYALEAVPQGGRRPRLMMEMETLPVSLRRIRSIPPAVVCRPASKGRPLAFEPGRHHVAEFYYLADSGYFWRPVQGSRGHLTVGQIPDFASDWCKG